MTSRQRLASRRAIQGAIARVGMENLALLKKEIDKSYPFGERAYYPYKIWLEERRKYFLDLGIYHKFPDGRSKKIKPRIKHDYVSPGQLSLFDFE